jgi:hypothetical protein
VKLGRFWTRDERRRHAAAARQRKQLKKQLDLRSPALPEEVNAGAAADVSNAPDVMVELCRNKLVRCRARDALDDFTTLSELLVHGQRDVPTSPHEKTYNPLLSVTTV